MAWVVIAATTVANLEYDNAVSWGSGVVGLRVQVFPEFDFWGSEWFEVYRSDDSLLVERWNADTWTREEYVWTGSYNTISYPSITLRSGPTYSDKSTYQEVSYPEPQDPVYVGDVVVSSTPRMLTRVRLGAVLDGGDL